MVASIGLVRRNKGSHIADHEQFTGACAEYSLWVNARVRAGDHQRFRALPLFSKSFVARTLGGPDVGAKSTVTSNETIHYFPPGARP
jgi:hypothetical protein